MCKSIDVEEALLELGLGADLQALSIDLHLCSWRIFVCKVGEMLLPS